ncbi:25275_t:CDS:1 [Dentiscutata erythropus]|uniref:25275_t:CDS:1 n=1 Tax=Dentiscutata erythropus TaxID=1348616 RepID=A0A9N9D5L7_9GLOM|nr:25275_t:CDS:1 [Dentiscutata erythropus]
MSFMVDAKKNHHHHPPITNIGAINCSIYNLDAADMYSTFQPDPVPPAGAIMQFFVSQTLAKLSTVTTKLLFAFTDLSGNMIGYTVHPVETSIPVIQDSYNVVVPDFIPDNHTVTVVITDIDGANNCISFSRNSRGQ